MIVFSVKISEKHREKLKAEFPNQKFIFNNSPREAEEYVEMAEVYVTYGEDITEELVDRAVNLKWIACLSAGIENFPFEKLEDRGILVTNARGIHKIQMSEYAIAMLLQVYRNSKKIIENERNAKWDKAGIRLKEITGKTILILGTGAIGSETARLAKAFNMRTIGISRSGKPVENFDEVHRTAVLTDILPKADMIVSVVPSTKETKYLFTYEQFKEMKESAVFLNMGRGDVLIEDDLLRAIREGCISHAVLDVFEEEPLPEDHAFWKEENITVTPHISGPSPEYIRRALEIFRTNLSVYEQDGDEYINSIDLSRGY